MVVLALERASGEKDSTRSAGARLGIDEQWITPRKAHEDTVFDGMAVTGEACDRPCSDLKSAARGEGVFQFVAVGH